MRRLKGYVHVDGVSYGPHDEVPADVAAKIHDYAWEDDGAAQPNPEVLVEAFPDGPAPVAVDEQLLRSRMANALASSFIDGVLDEGEQAALVDVLAEAVLGALGSPQGPSSVEVPELVDADDEGQVEAGAGQESPAPPRPATGPIPNKSGKGSSTKAWADYAVANGVKVKETDGRDEIIAALKLAGIATEQPED